MARKVNQDRENYQKALMELISCRPVAYWPALARKFGGVKAAVMLSQLLYWNGDPDVKKRNGWLRKSVEDMEEETGLTKLEQQTAREILSQSGIIDCVLKGLPRIWNYRVNLDAISDNLIGSVSHPMENPSNGKPAQHSHGILPNIEPETSPILDGSDTQLNKVLKTTSLRLHNETTSSSSSVDSHEEEEEVTNEIFTAELAGELSRIGVYKDLWPEIQSTGLEESALLDLLDQAETDEPEYGKTAALFIYRLRNRPDRSAQLSPEERDARDRRRYADSLKKYGIES